MNTLVSCCDEFAALLRNLTEAQLSAVAPFLTDLMKVARGDGEGKLDYGKFRKSLSLIRLLPQPKIIPLPGIVLPNADVNWEARRKAGAYDGEFGCLYPDDLPLRFPDNSPDLVLVWFHFNHQITTNEDVHTEEVKAWAAQNSYEVSPIDDLFAVGAHPEYGKLQWKFPIVALGSPATRFPGYFPGLDHTAAGRLMGAFRSPEGYWAHSYNFHFLLRKRSQPPAI